MPTQRREKGRDESRLIPEFYTHLKTDVLRGSSDDGKEIWRKICAGLATPAFVAIEREHPHGSAVITITVGALQQHLWES